MTVEAVRPRLDDRYREEDGRFHMTGIHALARLPLDVRRADRRMGRNTAVFISGYEGSPLGGLDLELSRCQELLDAHQVIAQPGVNEELAATAVQGTQFVGDFSDRRFDGVVGLWYGKSPGLDRSTDAMRHNNLMGTHPAGGALALVGDDPAAKSSTVPGASDLLLADLGMPTLFPADPQDVLDLGLHGVAMSRVSGLWVAIKMMTNVADGAGTVVAHPDRVSPAIPDLTVDGKEYRHRVSAVMLQPHIGAMERSRAGPRLELARRYAAANGLNRLVRASTDDRVGIMAAGKTFLDLTQALHLLGLDDSELARRGIRLLRLGMTYPLEPTIVRRFVDGLDVVVVVEEKRSFVEAALKEMLYGRSGAPLVSGKRSPDGAPLVPEGGELDADLIAKALAPHLASLGDFPTVEGWLRLHRAAPRERIEIPLVSRTPYFCSGCPHNTSTKVPHGSLVGAGIGCHALVLLMDGEHVGEVTGITQMGGEGAQWIGMAPFLDRRHLLQNLGDGTFHHSGSLAIRAAVAAGVNVTFKLLYNAAVAMTGGQQPAGAMSIPDLTRSLSAEGVRRIIVTTENPEAYRRSALASGVQVWHRDRVVEAQEVLAGIDGVTVLIHDQECATELRRKRKRGLVAEPTRRVFINERVCEGCGDCGEKSNCLSVQPVDTEFGRKTKIDQSSCNKDYSCLKGDCPSFLAVIPQPGARRHDTATTLEMFDLPEPPVHPSSERHTTRITGVGGSGVVTLSQILGVAATLDGLHVRALDQTGLAQKGGAVVSDIKIGTEPFEAAHKAAAGECDLYLGSDLLVAAEDRNLAALSPERTVAVVSTSEVPTGRMITDASVRFPSVDVIADRLRSETRQAIFLDARGASNALLGHDQFANLLLLGCAYQSGALPVSAAAIEEAITLNGVGVEANLRAFRYGRQMVVDPDRFPEAITAQRAEDLRSRPFPEAVEALVSVVRAPDGSELARLVARRIPDLIAYQSPKYARRYARRVERVREVEAERVPGTTELAEAVARYLYKLMAYKDEYEVARLSIDPGLDARLRAEFGRDAKVTYLLHPPVLRALGLKRKLAFGRWFRPALSGLVSLRRLRGTPFDPFGHARVRRTERELVTEYESLLDELCETLRPENHAIAIQLASLPDIVRGYEEIKMGNVERYRQRVEELRAELV